MARIPRQPPPGVEIAPRAQGLSWLRGPAAIEDGWVTLRGGEIEQYQFEAHPGFLDDLVNVRRPEAIVRFVAAYGLLWEGQLDPDDFEWLSPMFRVREPVERWLSFVAELREIQRLYCLSQWALHRGEPHVIASLRKAAQEIVAFPAGEALVEVLSEAVAGFLSVLVTERIEENAARFLVGVSDTHGRYELLPAAATLAGHAWLQLAAQLLQHIELGECPACGRIFVLAPRQRYCSTRCATRQRVRRHRRRSEES